MVCGLCWNICSSFFNSVKILSRFIYLKNDWNRFVANRWLNQLKNDRKLEMELFGSEQPGLNKIDLF